VGIKEAVSSRQSAVRGKITRAVSAVVGLLVLSEALFYLAALAGGPIDFDVGPSTGAYLDGFTESEERPPVSFRWTGPQATIRLPFNTSHFGREKGQLHLRFARFLDPYARARVYLSGQQVAAFSVRPGRFRTQTIPVALPDGPLRLEIVTEDPDPSHLGIAVDWVRLEGDRWRFPMSNVAPRLLVTGGFVLALASGFSIVGSFWVGLVLACVQAIGLAFDPFGLAHVSSKIVLPGLLLAVLIAMGIRIRRASKWIALLFLLGFLLKGMGIFHPSYFYPDVRNHRRYVYAFAQAKGSITERGVEAQMQVRTAYPRWVAGRAYAFPYSPLFFIPFTWFTTDHHLAEDALKYAALAAAATEVVAVYVLASLILGRAPAVAASLLAVFLPPMYSRLFLAMWPTVVGHFLDLVAICAAAGLAATPSSLRRLAGFGAATFASFLTYISSLFNLSSFIGFFALLQRKLTWRVLAVGAGAGLVTVLLLYTSFILTFLTEILPHLSSTASDAAKTSPLTGTLMAFDRLRHFYGFGFLALAAAGIVLASRSCSTEGFRTLLAYGLSFVFLVTLRGLSGGLFKDLKEILYVGPWIAVTAGASVASIASRGRSGRIAAAFVMCGLVIYWSGKFAEYFLAYASLAGLDTLD
jgi:hypothetical protein